MASQGTASQVFPWRRSNISGVAGIIAGTSTAGRDLAGIGADIIGVRGVAGAEAMAGEAGACRAVVRVTIGDAAMAGGAAMVGVRTAGKGAGTIAAAVRIGMAAVVATRADKVGKAAVTTVAVKVVVVKGAAKTRAADVKVAVVKGEVVKGEVGSAVAVRGTGKAAVAAKAVVAKGDIAAAKVVAAVKAAVVRGVVITRT